ncbi:MAG: hypothetical protein ACYTBV_21130 [Planctomycetota bacterium]|jgi:hypothetical protein
MKPIAFNPENDLAPIPFNKRVCRLAMQMKQLGLPWQTHVGCFVWDPDGFIKADSPFPDQIYFILSLPRFIDIFGTVENIAEKLVWLPTWHQARLLCQKLGLSHNAIADMWQNDRHLTK